MKYIVYNALSTIYEGLDKFFLPLLHESEMTKVLNIILAHAVNINFIRIYVNINAIRIYVNFKYQFY